MSFESGKRVWNRGSEQPFNGVAVCVQIATLSTRINLSMPFFGVVFFWASWVFLATTLLSVFVAVVRCRRSNIDSHDSDSDETE